MALSPGVVGTLAFVAGMCFVSLIQQLDHMGLVRGAFGSPAPQT